jgi:tetratricopeptide (TPR) repeat protein
MTARPQRSNRPRSADFVTPLTVAGGAVAGADLVRELPPEVALPLWQGLRSVLMWAGEEPAMRGGLFEPCAMADWERELLEASWDPDARCPLAVLVRELADPVRAVPETLSHGCLCITEWALEHRYTATALAFAEAAALAWPQHPRWAWMAGRLMRAHGRPREAEMWLRRAERAATKASDWEGRALALNSLGNGYYEAGDYRASVRALQDALRVSRKHRLRQLEGEILHDLFAVNLWSGDLEKAEPLAKAAFEIYKSGHDRLAALAHDVAVFWIKRGYFARAFKVLKELPAFYPKPEERVRVLASLARAAAECDESEVFTRAAAEARALTGDDVVARRAAPAMLEVGLGAWSLQMWETAEEALLDAIHLGGRTGETDVTLEAEAALRLVQARQPVNTQRTSVDLRRTTDDPMVSGFLAHLHSPAGVAAVA